MKTVSSKLLAVLLVFLVAGGVSCVLEEKVIELVMTGSTCLPFDQDEASEVYTKAFPVNYGAEINRILDDIGVDKEDIVHAAVMSATYTVNSVTGETDWVISGEITVERTDDPAGPLTLIGYDSVPLRDVIGVETAADLAPSGVSLLNDALHDYVHDDALPQITFRVESGTGDVDPDPDSENHLIFTWTACVKLDIVVRQSYDVPQLF
jgi:hypothetical protein